MASEEAGRLSNPAPRPIQRRLGPPDIDTIAGDYQAGQSLRTIAKVLGVHRNTIAAHLDQLGIARRATRPKMNANDIHKATQRYETGDSLATIAAAFHVNATTIRRELAKAGTTIRPRRGWT
jgi:DNA-binding transcriptional regulator LsrR (DeoR family)